MHYGTNHGTYGLTEKFDHAHYLRVLDARRSAGLPVRVKANLIDHPMFGRRLVKKDTNQLYIIDHVHEAWKNGFYFYAMARTADTNSHIGLVIGNRNSKAQDILALLDEFENTFDLVN